MSKNLDYFNGKNESDKKIIHLYVLEKCSHKCKLCCNKLYNTDDIPVVTVNELKEAETICLTGGEPFLVNEICDYAKQIKLQYPNIKQVYVYTCGDSLFTWLKTNKKLHSIDGVNISPKNKYDVECVRNIFANKDFRENILGLWSNRIYVFPNVRDLKINGECWNWREMMNVYGYESIKIINREWQEEFEPDSGIFRRLPILLG